MAAIDGKQIANMLYHAGVETPLTIGYSELGRKLLRRLAPKVDLNMGDIAMLSIDILQAMATRDISGKQLDPLPPEPKLSDYYAPSSDQQNRELLFIVAGMAATGFLT